MTSTTFTFPETYHEFHKDQTFNFQLNRWYSMGYARLEDMKAAGQKIHSFKEWNTEMVNLAEAAASEDRFVNAAFYYRAAEFFTTRDDPQKEALYEKFIALFYRASQNDGIKQHKVPYKETFMHALQVHPTGRKKGTLVVHGGNDSFVEEFYSLIGYFADNGYEVIAFDGPGQGATRKQYGLALEYEWEKPVKAVLDYFQLDDVTLLGVSMGGWLCLRAAALEPRIKRVIAWSVSFDVTQYANIIGQQLAQLFMKRFRNFVNNSMKKNMNKSLQYSWFVNNLMYITAKKTPIEAFDVLLNFNQENLHSGLIRQDVLILTGKEDHLVPFKMHDRQVRALTGARSVTARIFAREEQAHNHCQIGNVGLALDVIGNWIEQVADQSNSPTS